MSESSSKRKDKTKSLEQKAMNREAHHNKVREKKNKKARDCAWRNSVEKQRQYRMGWQIASNSALN